MNRGTPDKGYGIRSWMHSDAFSRTPGKFYEFMSGVRLKINKKSGHEISQKWVGFCFEQSLLFRAWYVTRI